ncbi:MAG: hypothetical protein NVS2B9_18940 [Myxococcales bacterium]
MRTLEMVEGQEVLSADGQKVGRIVTLTPDTLVIEKGFLLPEDLACRRSDVAEIRGSQVLLSISRAQLEERAGGAGTAARDQAPGQEMSGAGAQALAEATGEEVAGSGGAASHP